MHCALHAIEHPTEDLFDGVPKPFLVVDQLLLRDGVLPVVASGGGWWKELVYGMEEGPTVVSECGFIPGLEETDIVINIDFKQVPESSPVVGVGEVREVVGVELRISVVEHVSFHWVRW